MFGNILAGIGRIGYMLGTTPPTSGEHSPLPADPSRQIGDAVWSIAAPVLGVLGGLGALLAIWLGVQLATAQDEGKRKEAKARLIYALIGVVVIFGMMGVFAAVRNVWR